MLHSIPEANEMAIQYLLIGWQRQQPIAGWLRNKLSIQHEWWETNNRRNDFSKENSNDGRIPAKFALTVTFDNAQAHIQLMMHSTTRLLVVVVVVSMTSFELHRLAASRFGILCVLWPHDGVTNTRIYEIRRDCADRIGGRPSTLHNRIYESPAQQIVSCCCWSTCPISPAVRNVYSTRITT